MVSRAFLLYDGIMDHCDLHRIIENDSAFALKFKTLLMKEKQTMHGGTLSPNLISFNAAFIILWKDFANGVL